MPYQHKPKHPGYGRDGRRLAYISDLSPDDIEREFVGDMVAGFTTALDRYVEGAQRIAALTKKPIDDVHVAIMTEAQNQGMTEVPGV
jgi:hypothetical protein